MQTVGAAGAAAQRGAAPRWSGAVASYCATRRLVAVAPDYAAAPTWMLADVLAQELRHAADRRI